MTSTARFLGPAPLSVRGKSALVTGASSGIGRILAQFLLEEGCHVVAAARRVPELEAFVSEMEGLKKLLRPCGVCRGEIAEGTEAVREQRRCRCREKGDMDNLLPLYLDVTWPEADVDAAVGRAWDHFGGLDIVVNNAGYRGPKAGVLDIADDDFGKALLTNVRGTWVVSKAAGRRHIAARTADKPPAQEQQRQGGSGRARTLSIINISSIAGIEGALVPGAAAYAASKAGVIRLTKALALELGPHGIRCNAIAPGLFRSEITEGLFQQPWLQRNAEVVVPLQRWGRIHPDLTGAVLFLASECSEFVTGACLVVDGGNSLTRMRLSSRL